MMMNDKQVTCYFSGCWQIWETLWAVKDDGSCWVSGPEIFPSFLRMRCEEIRIEAKFERTSSSSSLKATLKAISWSRFIIQLEIKTFAYSEQISACLHRVVCWAWNKMYNTRREFKISIIHRSDLVIKICNSNDYLNFAIKLRFESSKSILGMFSQLSTVFYHRSI